MIDAGADDGDPARLVSLKAAATAVGVSSSTLRRWADDGRLPAIRTAGGHRRFPLEGVRRLAADQHPQAIVRPVDPPARALVALAELLREHGAALVTAASAALYRDGHAGAFGREDLAQDLAGWLAEVARACETAQYDGALAATDAFMRRRLAAGDAAAGALPLPGPPRGDDRARADRRRRVAARPARDATPVRVAPAGPPRRPLLTEGRRQAKTGIRAVASAAGAAGGSSKTAQNASTIAGSNWSPAQRRSSARARPTGAAAR